MSARRLAVIALVLLLAGAAMAGAGIASNARIAARPLRLALPLPPGEAAGRFVADVEGRYELEVEVPLAGAPQALLDAVRVTDAASALGVEWAVRNDDGALVASGDSRQYLYVTRWVGRAARLRDRLLRLDAPPPEAVLARGVGAFWARAGERYELRSRGVGSPFDLRAAGATVSVRVGRAFWAAYTRTGVHLVLAGAGVAALGVLAAAAAGVRSIAHRRRAAAGAGA